MKILCLLSMCFTSLALLAYPFVLMGGIMGIAAYSTATPSSPLPTYASWIFFWGSLLYPLPYLVCLIASIVTFKKSVALSMIWQGGLLAYLFLLAVSFVVWLSRA